MYFLSVLCLALALLFSGCRETPPEPPRVLTLERDGTVLRLQLSRPLDLVRVEQLDGSGRTTHFWLFTSGARTDVRLEPAPPPGRQRLRFIEANRHSHRLEIDAPEPPVSGLRAKLELPLGIPDAGREVWLPAGAQATLSLLVERDSAEPLGAQLRLICPPGLRIKEDAENGWTRKVEGESLVLVRRVRLRDREQFLLTVTPLVADRVYPVSATITPADAPAVTVQARVRGAAIDDVRRWVQLSEARLPTDRFGEFDATRRTDVLQMPTRFGQYLHDRFGGMSAPRDGEEPFTFQSANVVNRSDTALAVEVRAFVRVDEQGPPCPEFAPSIVLGKSAYFVSVPALIPPGSDIRVTLPIFVRPETLPGDYRRNLEVRLLGTDAVVAALDAPLRVEQTDRPAFFIDLFAALVTLVALPLLAWRMPTMLSRFAAVELIQIALFGSAAFLLVGVPARLMATLLNALLPIFSPFILGLYGQVVALAILGALVVLVPRPGVVLLAGLTRFLLNGVFFGAFSPVDFLYVVPVLLLGEACLWLIGVTRRPDAPVTAWRLALACAVMGVAAAGLQLSLEMSLFRLYFADWYVTLFLVLDGALYPAVGAVLGAHLGATLKRTAE